MKKGKSFLACKAHATILRERPKDAISRLLDSALFKNFSSIGSASVKTTAVEIEGERLSFEDPHDDACKTSVSHHSQPTSNDVAAALEGSTDEIRPSALQDQALMEDIWSQPDEQSPVLTRAALPSPTKSGCQQVPAQCSTIVNAAPISDVSVNEDSCTNDSFYSSTSIATDSSVVENCSVSERSDISVTDDECNPNFSTNPNAPLIKDTTIRSDACGNTKSCVLRKLADHRAANLARLNYEPFRFATSRARSLLAKAGLRPPEEHHDLLRACDAPKLGNEMVWHFILNR